MIASMQAVTSEAVMKARTVRASPQRGQVVTSAEKSPIQIDYRPVVSLEADPATLTEALQRTGDHPVWRDRGLGD